MALDYEFENTAEDITPHDVGTMPYIDDVKSEMLEHFQRAAAKCKAIDYYPMSLGDRNQLNQNLRCTHDKSRRANVPRCVKYATYRHRSRRLGT